VCHGRNGWVVSEGSAGAYARAIVRLLTDLPLRTALGAAARHTVEDEYGWDRIIDQVEATYGHVLVDSPPERQVAPGGTRIPHALGSARARGYL
jgi:glycosyltransferase involved in cell wall biosynthesis